MWSHRGAMFVSKDSLLHQHVVEFIHHAWGSHGRFPGPQPVSIEYKHFDILKKNLDGYCVCEKTDGVRHLLVAMVSQNQRKVVLVNRSFDMFEISVNLPREAYNGTILDGELYEGHYLVYDAVCVEGYNTTQHNFIERFGCIETLLSKVITMKSDKYRIRKKLFYFLRDWDTFVNVHLPAVQERTDGVVFTPINEPVRTGTHNTLFKWKPDNTVDFQFKRDDARGCWRLMVQEKGQLMWETDLQYTVASAWGFLEEDAIIECRFDGERWLPVLRRHDKTHPNSRLTYTRTCVNVRENIQLDDFRQLLQ